MDVTEQETAGLLQAASPLDATGAEPPLMVWVTDPGGACTFRSQSWYDFTGQPAGGGLGLGWLKALHPDDRAPAEAKFLDANRRRVPFRIDCRIRRSDGVYRWAIDSGAPRFGPQGEFLGYIGAVIDISERKQAEEALRRSEAKFATAFNAGPILLTMTRLADGRFVEVNESFLNTTGFTRDEVLGRTPFDLNLWVQPAKRLEGLQRLHQGLSVRGFESEIRMKDGTLRTFLMSADLVDVDGETCVLTALTDITARKQAEVILERYQLLSERTQDIVLFTRADGQIVEANQAAVAAYGHDRATLLTKRIQDLYDEAALPEADPQLALANQHGVLFETVHRRSDGSTFPVEVSSIGADLGGERMLLSIIRDISERKRAEREAQIVADLTELIRLTEDADELLWRAAQAVGEHLQAQRCFFIDIDAEHDRALVHRQYCRGVPPVPPEVRITDYTRQSFEEIAAGRTIVNCDSQRDPRTAADYEHIYRAYGARAYVAVPLLREGRWVALLWVSTNEPRQWAQREVTLAEVVAERVWMAVEKLRLYAAEQRARAVAEAAVRARDQFLQVVSHELKTPLTTLLGNAQLLERRTARDGSLPERHQRMLRTIADQAARLNQMISSLLDITRFESGQVDVVRAPLDLAALVRRVVDDVRPGLVRHRIEVEAPAELAVVGDGMRLEQVFRNLLSNAIKYSPAGGRIGVRIEPQGEQVAVQVADEGMGIPAEALPHLFQRFYRASRPEMQGIDGTGLGLYVVREIVALHGGVVTVESEVGRGSVFTVRLPLPQDAATA